MKFKDIIYIFLMIIFMVLAYLLIDRGINAKTKIYVNYNDNSNVVYKVYLHDNDIYDKEYLNMNDRYPSSLVDNIDFEFNFKSLFTSDINGYYSYNIEGLLVVYTDDINDSLFQKKYILLDNIVEPLNSNNTKSINIFHTLNIDYDKYKDELKKVSSEYDVDASGYLEVRFNVLESLSFRGIDKIKEDKKQIKLIIPLSYDNFRINVINDNNINDNYYDFSRKQPVNYVLLIIGAFSLALGISFFALVLRGMIISYKNENKYNRELKKILNDYSEIIVNVKKFYNKKKYNLVYVDSFKELLDVYDKVRNPISFKEVRKNNKAIFLIIDNDNAWIYRMSVDNIK